jgi:hypothetical protein
MRSTPGDDLGDGAPPAELSAAISVIKGAMSLMGTSKNGHRSSGTPDLPTTDSVLFSVRFCAVHAKDAGDFRPLQFFEAPSC